MDSSIRASAFAGLGAFALSAIVAVFSRVPFGALVLRALLSGIVFAGLTFGALWVLRRFLPELFDEAAIRPESSGVGTLVDIVLPGGDEERQEPRAAPYGETPVRASATEPVDSINSGDLEREVADLRNDILVASDPVESGATAAPIRAPRPSVSLDELDTLPDLDGFSDSFASVQLGEGDSNDESPGGRVRPMGVSDSMPTAGAPGGSGDPAVLAKAVQTLLRKDQKGQ